MLNTHLHFTPAAPSNPVKMPGEKEQGIARLFNLLLFATRQMVTLNNYRSKRNTEEDCVAWMETSFKKFVLSSTGQTWIIQQVPFPKAEEGTRVATEVEVGMQGD